MELNSYVFENDKLVICSSTDSYEFIFEILKNIVSLREILAFGVTVQVVWAVHWLLVKSKCFK